ncbi:hypothetical protein [Chitinophaga sp. Ak27]|uniref:hypothetical protein n=1 Tax=Chitinophaga sp. Ak27 TaxID=2726116 RepID=UPI00145D004E|nr:hypothetical protein [Chitinophaga sp. Ak27]NLU94905.1 hypothetical protein [Chitinophaga sp. Ak27]
MAAILSVLEFLQKYIGVYGAVVSTILATRAWRLNRPRIETTYYFSGNPQSADYIAILNNSTKNITISYVELFLSSKSKLFFWPITQRFISRKKMTAVCQRIQTGDEDDQRIFTILPFKFETYGIDEQFAFSIPSGKSLYIQLTIMGKTRKLIQQVC